MPNFNTTTQSKFLFGPNQENDVGRQIKYLGGSKVLIHYSTRSPSINNLIDKVKRSLKTAGLDCVELGESHNNPRIETVFDGIKLCKYEHVDFILAIGSLQECSSAKVIAAGVQYEENFYEMFQGQNELETALPVGVINTTVCGGGATRMDVAVYHKLDDGTLTIYECKSPVLVPQFIIYNSDLCQFDYLPLEYSFVRILSVLFCRFFSENQASFLSDRLILASIQTVLLMHEKLQDKPNDIDCINNMMWASISANVNPMYDTSRVSCIETLSKAMICEFDCSSEQAASIIIPAWFEFVSKKKTAKIAQLGTTVFGIPYDFSSIERTADKTVKKIHALFESLSMPVKLSDLNANASDIERILFKAGFPEIGSIGIYDQYSKTDCEVILSLAL